MVQNHKPSQGSHSLVRRAQGSQPCGHGFWASRWFFFIFYSCRHNLWKLNRVGSFDLPFTSHLKYCINRVPNIPLKNFSVSNQLICQMEWIIYSWEINGPSSLGPWLLLGHTFIHGPTTTYSPVLGGQRTPNDADSNAPKQLSPIAKRCRQQCQTMPQPFSDRQTDARTALLQVASWGSSLTNIAATAKGWRHRRKCHGLTTLQAESNMQKRTPFLRWGSSLSFPTTVPFSAFPKPEPPPSLMASESP